MFAACLREHSGNDQISAGFPIGTARDGAVLSVVYTWSETDPAVIETRLI